MDGNVFWWKKGMHDGVPLGFGYLAVAFTFGIMARNAHLSVSQATLMSATNYTSAGQFAALALIASFSPYLEMALTQLIINLRYSLMSAALSQKLASATPFFQRCLLAVGITDEIFSVSALVPGQLSPFYTYGLMCVAMPAWTAGTFLGVELGSVLSPRLLSALNIALYGMFLAIIVPPAKGNKIIAALVVFSMAASTLFAFAPILREISSGFRIILLTLAIAGAAAWFFPVRENDDAR